MEIDRPVGRETGREMENLNMCLLLVKLIQEEVALFSLLKVAVTLFGSPSPLRLYPDLPDFNFWKFLHLRHLRLICFMTCKDETLFLRGL